jgi:hypothetical protein
VDARVGGTNSFEGCHQFRRGILLSCLQLGMRLSLMARTTMENRQARKKNNNDGRRRFGGRNL